MRHSKSDWLPALTEGITKTYQTGEIICRPEKSADQFFIVQQGEARIYLCTDNKELTIGYLKPNSIYVTHTRAWIEAMTETTIKIWSISQLKTIITLNANIALSAMQEIGTMLRNTLDIIENLAFRSVESRLAYYLLLEYHQQKQTTITITGNTEILASLLGTSRQTLSTILNRLIKDNVIQRTDRQRLTLLKLDYLEQLATGMSAS
ncbi:cAMP-binding protein [Beggiatoa alba B18LD]|uniref:cAMP-binding protein n=2 Tax=Beggiatoa alba TaxID=1022 RepID=I3CI16_9GAMM|nr:cAMP-binding protein [Beggiatoa alba B18LD]